MLDEILWHFSQFVANNETCWKERNKLRSFEEHRD